MLVLLTKTICYCLDAGDSLCKTVPETYTSETKSCFRSPETKKVVRCVLKIQKWWKGILLLRARKKSILIVQAYVRGWLVRQETTRKRRCTVIIQVSCLLSLQHLF